MTDRQPGQVHRSTTEGRAYLELRALAKADDRTSAEYLRLYALEGFLARLAASPRRSDLVLKGGVLLAAYDLRRPTTDIDFAARAQSNATEDVSSATRSRWCSQRRSSRRCSAAPRARAGATSPTSTSSPADTMCPPPTRGGPCPRSPLSGA